MFINIWVLREQYSKFVPGYIEAQTSPGLDFSEILQFCCSVVNTFLQLQSVT